MNPYNMMGYGIYNGQTPRVNGRRGAEAFQMTPGSTVIMLDTSAPLVWYKEMDSAGVPSVTPYKIEPYVEEAPPAPPDAKTLETMFATMEARITQSLTAKMEEMVNAGKSYSGTAKSGAYRTTGRSGESTAGNP